ncbi:MAG TPA: DUF87 domain-containing protein [Actinocrinis sp.]|nr:DUF87 domain-containing protein [Actinocrinis sp.]
MTPDERRALSTLRFNSAPTLDDVWRPAPCHVAELHRGVVERVFEGVDLARRSAQQSSPLGVVIQGPSGAGKTHMLGMVRERTQREGGYFFLIDLLDGKAFWESTALALGRGLLKPVSERETQLSVFLDRVGRLLGLPDGVRTVVSGLDGALDPAMLEDFIRSLRQYDRPLGQEVRDTARALVLYGSTDPELQDIGQGYLNSLDVGESVEDRAAWGMGRGSRTPQQIVRDISRLLALTGPTVMAIDQIDQLIAQSAGSVLRSDPGAADAAVLGQVADGLMSLRETTNRALTVVACLPDTWMLIKRHAATSVPDRFRETFTIDRVPSAEVGREIMRKRFEVGFAEVGFVPPYPTWPILEDAFADAVHFTPRALIRQVEWHVLECLRTDTVTELAKLPGGRMTGPLPEGVGEAATADEKDLAALDDLFARHRREADVLAALHHQTEDQVLPGLLAAGLSAWTTEAGGAGRTYKLDPSPGAKPALHARLRRVLDEDTENELHWALRGIAATHPIAAITRIRNACTMAALNPAVPARRLVLLRDGDWPRGPKTAEVVEAFHAAGGRTCELSEEDLKVFAALGKLREGGHEQLPAWLIARRPASSTSILRELLGDEMTGPEQAPELPESPEGFGPPDRPAVPGLPDPPVLPEVSEPREFFDVFKPRRPVNPTGPYIPSTPTAPTTETASSTPPPPTSPDEPDGAPSFSAHVTGPDPEPWSPEPLVSPSATTATAAAVPLGVPVDGGDPFTVDLEALRKHTVIFAGSGSGKTVLIRRLVEECALQGVSAIVLDPNNDLGRLGEPWPQPPAGWSGGDRAKAEEYLANTDVVVWTPRITAGRPLSFQPLPNFAAVRDDPDELRAAIDIAAGALAPRAKVDGNTPKAGLGQAVLREALGYYARHGSGGLRAFVELLGDLPEGVSNLPSGVKTGAELAERLTAAMVNDPLFGGDGVPVDPGLLLTPAPGRRARISVISFIGLNADEQRQGFVNQLQMALFAWIKRNPAGDRPLGGLFVMDEAQTFAPSAGKTPCTESTLALASQARKYGLGLVFATQMPKGLHNRISGNAATQFFGLLNSPVAIEAAKDMAQAKGGAVPDISRLTTGQFYAAREGHAFLKIQAPLCLSHHPRSPLTAEEVVERAQPDRDRIVRQYG